MSPRSQSLDMLGLPQIFDLGLSQQPAHNFWRSEGARDSLFQYNKWSDKAREPAKTVGHWRPLLSRSFAVLVQRSSAVL